MNWRRIFKGPIPAPLGLGLLGAAPILGIMLHYLFLTEKPANQMLSNIPEELIDKPRTLQPFNLLDGRGEPFDLTSLKGNWSYLILGFTHCPDVCPFVLGNLAVVYQKMAKELSRDRIPQVIFLSVDPGRDTPETLKNYVQHFNPAFKAATGNKRAIDKFVDQIGGYYKLGAKRGEGEYDVVHSAEIFVIDPSGRVFAKLKPPLEPALAKSAFLSLKAAYEPNSVSSVSDLDKRKFKGAS